MIDRDRPRRAFRKISFGALLDEIRYRLEHPPVKTIEEVAIELGQHPQRIADALDTLTMIEIAEKIPGG